MYDYLIVGAGLYGAVFAEQVASRGAKCLVIDKRPHIAGNAYTRVTDGINVHVYGAHIFHTSNDQVWQYVNKFAEFNNYVNSPIAYYKGQIYNLPFNMNTFNKMWGVITPQEAEAKIAEQRTSHYTEKPQNLEQQAINLVGVDIYERLIKHYTEKQWGRSCKELPADIIKRLPVRLNYDNNYFNDKYQGIPVGGYTQLVQDILSAGGNNIEVKLNCDFFKDYKDIAGQVANKVVFTGAIDEYFDYCCGALQYRSVRFETETLDVANYQGVAVVNYTDSEPTYTRIIEHKHFEKADTPKTIISKEYSSEWKLGVEPYYPVNDAVNQSLYQRYAELASREERVLFGGRLGCYQYLDMDKVIERALGEAYK